MSDGVEDQGMMASKTLVVRLWIVGGGRVQGLPWNTRTLRQSFLSLAHGGVESKGEMVLFIENNEA